MNIEQIYADKRYIILWKDSGFKEDIDQKIITLLSSMNMMNTEKTIFDNHTLKHAVFLHNKTFVALVYLIGFFRKTTFLIKCIIIKMF